MDRIKLIILTVIMISPTVILAHGQGYQPYPDDSQIGDLEFYTSITPSNPDVLVPLGQAQGFSGYGQTLGEVAPVNALRIVDPSGTYRRTSLSIPLSYWARQEAIPGISGHLTMHERYPSGIVHSAYLGYVNAGLKYMVWFRANLRGTHDIWYTVDGMESNHVSYDVYRSGMPAYSPFYDTPYHTPYYRYYPRTYQTPRPSPYYHVGTSTGARAQP